MGCIGRAILPIGVYNRRKEEKKLVVPRAAVAPGRQLKLKEGVLFTENSRDGSLIFSKNADWLIQKN